LELARALGQRGYQVALADANRRAGGRLLVDAALPGLTTWMRVAEHRLQAIRQMPNVSLYLDSRLDANQVLDFGFARVFLATGAHWRKDGLGRQHRTPVINPQLPQVLGPEDVMAGAALTSPVVIYDDDHYYMGGAFAERLARVGHLVHLITPAVKVSEFTEMTMEQHRIQAGLIGLGVQLHTSTELMDAAAVSDGTLALSLISIYGGQSQTLRCAHLVMVTMRDPDDALHQQLLARQADWSHAGIQSVQCLGDAYAPGTVAAAVYAGHRAARELDQPQPDPDAVPFRREMMEVRRD
jgi:dimethylamine/trimethylamine dehydrogenase